MPGYAPPSMAKQSNFGLVALKFRPRYQEVESMSKDQYSSDNPVHKKEDDRFARWQFSERIADIIAKRKDPNNLVIGLYSPWGNGKTSVINFIESILEKSPDCVCVTFNPWRFGNEDELLFAFFKTIAEALDAKLVRMKDQFKKILKKALPSAADKVGAKGLGDIVSSFLTSPDIHEFRKRTEEELKKQKKKVVIFIDDIDRLERSEIKALFRLIKLTANFQYTTYVLAFDPEIVAASLQDSYANLDENSGKSFLEKIIQVPLVLPAVQARFLREFCYGEVEEALKIAGIELTDQQIQEFNRGFIDAFEDCLTTPRKAKLYGNSLMFALPILKGEVNPIDLMFIEGIRVFCPPLYEFIRDNQDVFTGSYRDSAFRDANGEKERAKALIDGVLNQGRIINKPGFIQLLKTMFPKLQAVYANVHHDPQWYSSWSASQRICALDYYSRFFSYGIPRDDISDLEIQELINRCRIFHKSNPTGENPLFPGFKAKKADAMIRKFRQKASRLSQEDSIPLAKCVTQSAGLFPVARNSSYYGSPFQQAAMLVADLIQNFKTDDERKNFAEACVFDSDSIEFQIAIFRGLRTYEPSKPESIGFSEEVIKALGEKLGESVSHRISQNPKLLTSLDEGMGSIFYHLRQYLGEDILLNLVESMVDHDDTFICKLLEAYLPTLTNLETGISHKARYDGDHFAGVTKAFPVAKLLSWIEKSGKAHDTPIVTEFLNFNKLYGKEVSETQIGN